MAQTLKQKTIGAIIWNLLDRGGQQVLQMAMVIVVANILCPDDYALVAMLAIFTAVGNRRELLQIPDHEKLHPAERFAVTPDTSEFYIDVIHKIRTHHRHLIDYQQLEVTYQFQFGLVYPEIRFRFNDSFYERSDSELKKGMNRHRPGIDSSYSGRSQHYTFLFRMAHDLTEERGLARPRLASKKQTHICLFYNKPGNIQFKISTFHLSISDQLSGSKQS